MHEIAIYEVTKYITTRDIKYKNIVVNKGFIFDGASIPPIATVFFTMNDMKKGVKASCLHDMMCENKDLYKRKYATDILVEVWKQEGLDCYWYTAWKPCLVKFGVNLYQWLKGWK